MGCGASAKKYEDTVAVDPEQEEILKFLSKVPLFKQLPKDQHPILAKACEPRDFTPGQVVIRQGDIGKEFFIIRSGEASVHVDEAGGGVTKLPSSNNLRAGDYFGEKALVYDQPRTATIRAESLLSTLQITRHKFRELGLNEKFHFQRRQAVGKKPQRSKSKEPSKKSVAEKLFISEALKQNENLKVMVALDEEKVSLMVNICWKETVKSGTKIMSEDDKSADSFYVVQDGLFQVTMKERGDAISGTRADKKLGPGSSFGEMALLCVAPRSATISAVTDATVWVFDRDNFKRILMRNTKAQTNHQLAYLEGVELLKCLLPSERQAVAEALLELHYERDELIVEQGQPGIAFYILFDGEVAVIADGQEIKRLSASTKTKTAQYFGEMALLNKEPRTATVKVTSDVAKVLVLDRESFDMLLGPLEDIIKQDNSATGRGSHEAVKRPALKGRGKPREPVFRDELELVGLLGCGGFGTVELFELGRTKQLFALKSMCKGHIVRTGMQESILNEKEILWMCDSPFIIRLYAAYNTGQRLELLLEPALGGDLHITYQRKGLYGSKGHAIFYSAGVVCAFQHLHGMKVIYRDLKPENVLLNNEGHVKITDMGLAKVCVGKTFTACGTPDYFAPEMVKQEGHSFGLDWWTLGIFVYELLAGDPPFQANDPMAIYRNIVAGIHEVRFAPGCAGAAENFIKSLLMPEPQKRLPMLAGGDRKLEKHNFYAPLSWHDFRKQRVEPPYRPVLSGPKDRRNFRANPKDAPPQATYKDDGSGWDRDFADQ